MKLPNTNVTFSREVIEDCLLNSKVFRDAVIDQLFKPVSKLRSDIDNAIASIVPPHGKMSNYKIAIIKELREISRNRVFEFCSEFPKIVDGNNYLGVSGGSCLMLIDAKHLAEYYISESEKV